MLPCTPVSALNPDQFSKNIESWTIGAILSHGTSVNYATGPPILSHGTSVNYATGSLKSPKKARISCSSIQTQRARRKKAFGGRVNKLISVKDTELVMFSWGAIEINKIV